MPTFPRAMRLAHAMQYRAVYEARAKRVAGPFAAHVKPNDVGHWRLGLAVGRHIGKAVVRNRCKRLLREAFRLEREQFPTWLDEGELPRGYDLVIVLRSAEPATLEGYRRSLRDVAEALHRLWEKRRAREREQST